jgi:Zn-dependent peptidase ImmA (M78 family)
VTRKQRLARDALQRALAIRSEAGVPTHLPVCVFDLATERGVDVWFKALPSMEGMYSRKPTPAMVISSLRPVGRQVYTGGHELGHHEYGHGFRVDQLIEDGRQDDSDEEFLADCFAGFLLMPKAVVVRGFARRGWTPSAATDEQVFTVACWLGVGYDALLTHMEASLGLLDRRRAAALRRETPKKIKTRLLGADCTEELIVADEHWEGRAIDIQVGDAVLATIHVVIEHAGVAVSQRGLFGTILRGTAPGLGRIYDPTTGWASFVRVSRRGFVGRARFRHLEEVDDEDDAAVC